MKRLTPNKVRSYMLYRSDQELVQCPDCIAEACNDVAVKFNHDDPLAFMRLLFFNDPIPGLCTHSYGFHTANGRGIIETIKSYYYEYKSTS